MFATTATVLRSQTSFFFGSALRCLPQHTPTTITTCVSSPIRVLLQRSALLSTVSGSVSSSNQKPVNRIPLPQIYKIPFEDRLNYINAKQRHHRKETELLALFRGCTSTEELYQAFDVFKDMKDNLIVFDPSFYAEVLKVCLKLKDVQPIETLFNLPANARIYPSTKAILLLLKHYYDSKDFEATKAFHQIIKQRHPDQLNEVYYREHICLCRREGLLDEALKYRDEFTKLAQSSDKKGNLIVEVAKVLADKGSWSDILSLENKKKPISLVRLQVIASLKLGDQTRAKQLLYENATKSPLANREEYIEYCQDIKPTLLALLNEIIDGNNEPFGDTTELLLLRLQEEM